MTVRGRPLECEILHVQDLAIVASGADAETWPDIAQTYQAPSGHTSHGECGRERGTDGQAVPRRCSWQLLQPGGGEQVPGGSGRRVCPYQVH